jgi:hypothetical protein
MTDVPKRKRRLSFHGVVLALLGAVLTLWLLAAFFHLFLKGNDGLLILLFLLPLLGLFALLLILHTIVRPSKRAAAVSALALGAAILVVLGTPYIRHAGTHLFVAVNEKALGELTSEIIGYGKIHRMFGELNGELVASGASDVERDPPHGLRPRLPLEEVLARHGIDRGMYDAFAASLRNLRLLGFEVSESCIAFPTGSMLDNVHGLLYVRDGFEPPSLDTPVLSSRLVELRHIRGSWYWFGTS